MSEMYLHELFKSSINKKLDFKNVIEVVNYHNGSYGAVYYQGNKIKKFEGEDYYEKIHNDNFLKKLSSLGLNKDTLKVIVYNFEILRYCNFNNFNVLKNQNTGYKELVKDVNLDLKDIKLSITEKEYEYNGLISFIHIDNFKDE